MYGGTSVSDVTAATGFLAAAIDSQAVVGNKLYFTTPLDSGNHDLFVFDGTTLTDLSVANGFRTVSGVNLVGGKIYFDVYNPSGGYDLFQYDGATFTNITGGAGASGATFPTAIGNALYFFAYSSAGTYDLWKYQSGVARDLIATPVFAYQKSLTSFSGAIYFTALVQDPITGFYGGAQLWKYDGSSLTDLSAGIGAPSNVDELKVVGHSLYFVAPDPTGIEDLWRYDGASFADITTGQNINVGGIVAGRNSLYFDARTGFAPSYHFWKYDGARLTQIDNSTGYSFVTNQQTVGDVLYFGVSSSASAPGTLLRYDGSLTDIGALYGLTDTDRFGIVCTTLYFGGTTPLIGNEPYMLDVSDGAVPINATEGIHFTSRAVATFFDPAGAEPNASDDPGGSISSHYSATIDWGDGTTSAGTITYDPSTGQFTVFGDHTYAEEGDYTVTTVINHETAPALTITSAATVEDQSVVATGATISATERKDLTLSV
jgi:hypothetical protein